MSQEVNLIEEAKKKAAYMAVDRWLDNECRYVGIGSGSTVVYAIARIAQRVRDENLDVSFVPTSFQSKQLIIDHQLRLSELTITPLLDITFDGADEVDANLNLIKGGGGCLTQEKIVAYASKKLVIIADYRKEAVLLGSVWTKGIPIEVVPSSYVVVANALKLIGGNPMLRQAVNKAGPVVTDNGMFILDTNFSITDSPSALNSQIIAIPGVLESGLFVNMTTAVYFGLENGSVKEIVSANYLT